MRFVPASIVRSALAAVLALCGTALPAAGPLEDCNGNGILDEQDLVAPLRMAFPQQTAEDPARLHGSPAAADLNGDGLLDVFSANPQGDSVSVYLGAGGGTFQPELRFITGYGPVSVTAADLNGDGRLDLATANSESDDVSVLLGFGEGRFRAPQTFDTEGYAGSIIAADLNGDGRLDLITLSQEDGPPRTFRFVVVLLGNGDGTLRAAQRFVLKHFSYYSMSMTVGDLNGDGLLDLATADDQVGVSILLGNGDGTFQAETFLGLSGPGQGAAARSITGVDLNADGYLDLATGGYATPGLDALGAFAVFLGNGDGTFQTATHYRTSLVNVVLQGILAVDIDRDGRLDLVAEGQKSCPACSAGYVSMGFVVLQGNSDGTFRAPRQPFMTCGAAFPGADLSGDGWLDLVRLDPEGVSVFPGRSGGNFEECIPLGIGATAIAGADWNGDGRMDLAVAHPNEAGVLLGNGDGTIQTEQRFDLPYEQFDAREIAVADLNGDGRLDLAAASLGAEEVSILLGNGDGTFQSARHVGPGKAPNSIFAADFNRDGRVDLATANSFDLSVLLGNGDGTFQTPRLLALGVVPFDFRPNSIVAADLNADGRLDLAAAAARSDQVAALLGNGDGTFQAPRYFGTGPSTSPGSIAAADFNGDGRLDLATANGGNFFDVSVLLGNGDGTFQAPGRFDAGGLPQSIIAADLNGDGRSDLATANYPPGTQRSIWATATGHSRPLGSLHFRGMRLPGSPARSPPWI